MLNIQTLRISVALLVLSTIVSFFSTCGIQSDKKFSKVNLTKTEI